MTTLPFFFEDAGALRNDIGDLNLSDSSDSDLSDDIDVPLIEDRHEKDPIGVSSAKPSQLLATAPTALNDSSGSSSLSFSDSGILFWGILYYSSLI